ncbi:MAG TPA: hypothetical protein VMH28_17920 [Candidatus Acidoferrales bacterium]|nr:hypothetical protein [Candidatus Acidoferrales bacterium]
MKLVLVFLSVAASLPAQSPPPATSQAFDCYVEGAEHRMQAAPQFLTVDTDAALRDQLTRSRRILTVPGNAPNPHKLTGGMIYDWIGTVFIPGATLERVLGMLQDYDRRAQYFPEIVSASKLLCRTGDNRFGFRMTLKEPSVIETENDVVWERLDQNRWRCRSYSTKVREIGKQHNYLLRLNSYWRFAGTEQGVYVQGETITLSGEFSSLMRTIGSLAGINPEKSLRKTLEQMRESQARSGAEFPRPPGGLPDCGAALPTSGCPASSSR